MRRDIAIIKNELHCDAIRVTGSIPDRVNLAARAASEAGLDVWYSPFPCELEPEALHDHLVDSARRAEQLRKATKDAEVVFVAGCEVSLFNRGFLAGNDLSSRLEMLKDLADSGDPATFGALLGNLNASLGATVAAVRAEFAGRISYASGPWEFIDWAPFDIIGVDAYRTAENASHFREELRSLRVHGKPIAATEFGCCTYRGAAAAGGEGWLVLDESGDHSRVRRGTVRDEEEQAQYFTKCSKHSSRKSSTPRSGSPTPDGSCHTDRRRRSVTSTSPPTERKPFWRMERSPRRRSSTRSRRRTELGPQADARRQPSRRRRSSPPTDANIADRRFGRDPGAAITVSHPDARGLECRADIVDRTVRSARQSRLRRGDPPQRRAARYSALAYSSDI